jgi:Ras family protein
MYSINWRDTFNNVTSYHDKIYRIQDKTHVPIVLVGNKTDLESGRLVTTEEGRLLATTWNAVFLETSVKQRISILN